jgi:hypothetical protein
MNWTRVLLAGLAAGIVTHIADFVMHGVILAPTYMRFTEVFSQTPASPLYFALISICIGLAAAVLFGRTRSSWAPGWTGGLTFGLFVGLLGFFPNFYNSLVIEGMPYFLSWCWGGATMIDSLLAGTVIGVIVPRS